MGINEFIQLKYVVAAIVYSLLGIGVFSICILIFDVLTPKISFWEELVDKQNIAFSIFVAAFAIGISTIIASAIHS